MMLSLFLFQEFKFSLFLNLDDKKDAAHFLSLKKAEFHKPKYLICEKTQDLKFVQEQLCSICHINFCLKEDWKIQD